MSDLFADAAALEIESRWVALFEDYVGARASASPAAPRAIRPLRDESAAVYRDIWTAFAAFCAQRGVTLETLSTEDLESFAITRGDGEATDRYLRRVLALIERVLNFASQREGVVANRAARSVLLQSRYRYAEAAQAGVLPDFLTTKESARLIAYVTAPKPDPRSDVTWSWQDVRDRSAVALQLGAGITPGEVQRLRLQDIAMEGGTHAGVPWKLRLPANGNSPAHESPIALWAARQLVRWLAVRAQAQVKSDWVFASTRSGKPWSKQSCYDAGQAVLRAAGVRSGAGGTYRLRHTYVLRQMANGRSNEDIAHWLGLQDARSIERYRRVLMSPVDII